MGHLVEYLPSMCEALGLVLKTCKTGGGDVHTCNYMGSGGWVGGRQENQTFKVILSYVMILKPVWV